MEFLLVLGLPLLGGIALAATGHWKRAAEINSAFSLLTLLAAVSLTLRIV
jgi:hydrogenase-4 component F